MPNYINADISKIKAASDFLRESAKQHRLQGDNGHAKVADYYADNLGIMIKA